MNLVLVLVEDGRVLEDVQLLLKLLILLQLDRERRQQQATRKARQMTNVSLPCPQTDGMRARGIYQHLAERGGLLQLVLLPHKVGVDLLQRTHHHLESLHCLPPPPPPPVLPFSTVVLLLLFFLLLLLGLSSVFFTFLLVEGLLCAK